MHFKCNSGSMETAFKKDESQREIDMKVNNHIFFDNCCSEGGGLSQSSGSVGDDRSNSALE